MTHTESNIVLFSITLCWASSYIFMKNIPNSMSTFAYLTITTGIASIILGIVFFKRLMEFNREILLKSFLMAVILCGNLIFERLGVASIPASTASFISSLNIVIVPIILLFFRKKPSKNNLLGIAFILAGLAFTSGIKLGRSINIGAIYMVISCFFMASYIIAIDIYTKNCNPLLLGVGQMFFTTLIAFLLWAFDDPRTFASIHYTKVLLANIFLLAFFAKAYAYIMLMYSQKYANPISVTVIASTEPIVTMVLAILIPSSFGSTESFTLVKFVGALLIAFGAFCAGTNFLDKKGVKSIEGDTVSL
ncbi:DMT family transporter [Anaerotignum sp.]|uniref:DMT family transporter n=1 Tax=Anaerotignum sp. TaxID=2039241 RepID=UPI0027151A30|nr:DMT family transporter [Anaerotignum sp.]